MDENNDFLPLSKLARMRQRQTDAVLVGSILHQKKVSEAPRYAIKNVSSSWMKTLGNDCMPFKMVN